MTDPGFTISDGPEGEEPKRHRRGRPPRPKRGDVLSELLSEAELWPGDDGAGYASVPWGEWREHFRITSKDFRRWVTLRYHEKSGAALSGSALAEAVALAEAQALAKGDRGAHRRAWRRVAKHGGAIILDLGGANPWGERRAVEITAGGWRLLEPGAVPVAFLRAPDALPLPEPIAGAAQFGDLARFLNCPEGEILLAWAWLVTALRPFESGGAYPILALTGQQGSGKSLSSRFLQSLVDPTSLSGVAPPRDERDIYASAGARHLLAYDNLSGLRDDLADALCRISTGGAFMARAMYSDFDQAAMKALRPQLINGIPASIAARNDLADRCIALELSRPAHRIAEQELIAQWEAARPALLGLACDAIAAALRNLDRVTIEGEAPRMIDAALWAEGAAEGLGIEPGAMVAAWRENRLSADRDAVALDDLARAVVALMAARERERNGSNLSDEDRAIDDLEKSAEELWDKLSNKFPPVAVDKALRAIAGPDATRARSFPASVAAMSSRLKRLAPALKAAERIEIDSGRDKAGRWISLRRLPPAD